MAFLSWVVNGGNWDDPPSIPPCCPIKNAACLHYPHESALVSAPRLRIAPGDENGATKKNGRILSMKYCSFS